MSNLIPLRTNLTKKEFVVYKRLQKFIGTGNNSATVRVALILVGLLGELGFTNLQTLSKIIDEDRVQEMIIDALEKSMAQREKLGESV